ncbi:MAG: hypothetical protein AAGD07_13685 [Planctomycetota bacterium]
MTIAHFRRPTWALLLVAVATFGLRWWHCGESFWVDELHTAWCVEGSFDEVGLRARMGNQQALYFQGLWVYRFIVESILLRGGSPEPGWIETVLRLPSVLAGVATVTLLFRWVQKLGGARSTLLATATGMLYSLDANAVFFDTEARPYALVMLCIAGMLTCLPQLIDDLGTQGRRTNKQRSWIVFHGCGLFACSLHATAVAVVGPLIVFTALSVWRTFPRSRSRETQHMRPRWRFHAVMILVWIAALTFFVLSHRQGLWSDRHQWSLFARPNGLRDLWSIWPWTSYLILPALAAMGSRLGGSSPEGSCAAAQSSAAQEAAGSAASSVVSRGPSLEVLTQLAVVTILAVSFSTVAIWFLAAIDGVSLWHRRYLIGNVPLLAGFAGVTLLVFQKQIQCDVRRFIWSCLVVIGCFAGLFYQQETVERTMASQGRLVLRNEGWREAIAWIRERAEGSSTLWVDPGLIEQPAGRQAHGPALVPDELDYLAFVVTGPYGLTIAPESPSTWHVCSADLENELKRSTTPPDVLITRRFHRLPRGTALPERPAASFGRVAVFATEAFASSTGDRQE